MLMLFLTTITLYCILASNAISSGSRQPKLTKRSPTGEHSYRRTSVNKVLPPIKEDEEFSETGSDESSLFDFKAGSASPVDTFQDPNSQIQELLSHMRDGIEKYDIQNMLIRTASTISSPFNKEELLARALCQGPLGVSRYALAMRERLSSLLVQDISSICSMLDTINIPALPYKDGKNQPSLSAHDKDDSDDQDLFSFSSDGFDKFKTSEAVRTKHSSGSLSLDDYSIQSASEPVKVDSGEASLNFKWTNPYLVSDQAYFGNVDNVTPNHKLFYSKGDRKKSDFITHDDQLNMSVRPISSVEEDELDTSVHRGTPPSPYRRKRSDFITEHDQPNMPLQRVSSVEEDELDTSVHRGTPPSPYGRKRSDSLTDHDQPILSLRPISSVEEDDLDLSIHSGSSSSPHHTSKDTGLDKSPHILPSDRKSELAHILPPDTMQRANDLLASKNNPVMRGVLNDLHYQKLKFEPPKWIGN